MNNILERYAQYYAEKIWELIPSVYRHEDGLIDPPNQLRALVEVFSKQAAWLRISQDRLWEDQFVELSDDWVVPYIGDLVATRMVSALNKRARRVNVAKTVYYRRRKGTPRVLEELISDIAGWDGKLVEEFKRLARMRHGLDPAPFRHTGCFMGTPPGGLADLRIPRGTQLCDGPFDEFYYTLDMRKPRGRQGRQGIPKLGFHLYRLQAYRVEGVMPKEWPRLAGNRRFSIDPSGRDIQLFMPRNRASNWDEWRSAAEWQLPAPMQCQVLEHAEYVIGEGEVNWVQMQVGTAAATDLARFIGVRFISEAQLREKIRLLPNGPAIEGNAPVFREILRTSLIDDCGKAALLPNVSGTQSGAIQVDVAGTTVPRVLTSAGNLDSWTTAPFDKQLVIDPNKGRLLLVKPASGGKVKVKYVYGFSGPAGAGSYNRDSILKNPTVIFRNGVLGLINPTSVNQLADSATYPAPANINLVQDITIQAADKQRPFIHLDADWIFSAPANGDALLKLTGLWIGAKSGLANVALVLRGDYERVEIRDCSLDPGGTDAFDVSLAPVILTVEGNVEEMIVEKSIVGPICSANGGVIEKLNVCDSVVQSIADTAPAVELPSTDLKLERVTVLQSNEDVVAIKVNKLYATEALITGIADVANTQAGCFRFSAVTPGTPIQPTRVPRQYQSHLINDVAYFFTSTRFGDAGYSQLSESAPEMILRGAENGSEIGVFSSLINPIKRDGLLVKIEEYMPFGLIPVFIFET